MQVNKAPFEIPPLLLENQRQIVARIEREHAIVEGNRELIRIAPREERVKKVIPARGRCERVWEE